MATRMLQRRGTAAAWAAANPVLADGEIGVESDTGVIKVGDGATAWSALISPFLTRSLFDAKGDLIVGNADNVSIKLARGATGQRLTVQADGSLAWETPIAPVPTGLFDAKGDMIVGSANDVGAKVPVGANGTLLVADSAQAAGVKWSNTGLALDATSTLGGVSGTKLAGDRGAWNTAVPGISSGTNWTMDAASYIRWKVINDKTCIWAMRAKTTAASSAGMLLIGAPVTPRDITDVYVPLGWAWVSGAATYRTGAVAAINSSNLLAIWPEGGSNRIGQGDGWYPNSAGWAIGAFGVYEIA